MLFYEPLFLFLFLPVVVSAFLLTPRAGRLGVLLPASVLFYLWSQPLFVPQARVFGFQLRENFDRPYIACSITEFWRRWHISLTSWIREYLYTPLGGNRVPVWRTYADLWLGFPASGLWHGAAWTYIAWGAYNGVFLVLDRLFLLRLLDAFFYVITPSEAAQYPTDLPPAMPCPSTQADRLGLVPAWTALLAQDGVHALDTTATLWATHGVYPFELFPRAGTHWNAIGSALATAALEQALQDARASPGLAPLRFTWRLAPEPTEDDVDLANLMNLFRLPSHFDVPVVAVTQPSPPGGCRRQRIVIVGGSFMEAVAARLSVSPCVGSVVEYFYWQVARLAWQDGARSRVAVETALRDRELDAADIVILEQNESTIGAPSRSVAALRDWFAAAVRYPARPRSSPAPG